MREARKKRTGVIWNKNKNTGNCVSFAPPSPPLLKAANKPELDMVHGIDFHPQFLISKTINMEIKLLHFLFVSLQNGAPFWLLDLSLIIPADAFNCI